MAGFEYKVVPAPTRGLKARGVKGTAGRFAHALQSVMNEFGAEGWEYQRTDTLPVEERQGLTGKTTTYQNMLVFRRPLTTKPDHTAGAVALIEDQTEVLEEEPEAHSDPEAAGEDTPDKAGEDAGTAKDADVTTDTPDVPAEDPARPALQRSSEEAPFSFPWNKRAAQTANDDDPSATRPT